MQLFRAGRFSRRRGGTASEALDAGTRGAVETGRETRLELRGEDRGGVVVLVEGSARSRGARVGARVRAPGKLTVHHVRLDPRGVARGGVARRGHARGHRVLQILQGRRVARRELRVQEKVHRRASVVDARRRARRWAGRLGPTWQKARFSGATTGRSTRRFRVRETRRKNLTQVAQFFELSRAQQTGRGGPPA